MLFGCKMHGYIYINSVIAEVIANYATQYIALVYFAHNIDSGCCVTREAN